MGVRGSIQIYLFVIYVCFILIMVCYSAPECSNSSAKVYRFVGLSSDGSRREVWLQNCRRDKRSPASTFRLCEISYFTVKKMKMIKLNIYLFIYSVLNCFCQT